MAENKFLAAQPGFKVERNTEMARDLEAFCEKHNLQGMVVVTFDEERVATQYAAYGEKEDRFNRSLDKLAQEILVKLTDGTFLPVDQ